MEDILLLPLARIHADFSLFQGVVAIPVFDILVRNKYEQAGDSFTTYPENDR